MGAVGAAAGALHCEPAKQLGPGIEVAPVHGAAGLGEAVLQVRAAPGELLPLVGPIAAAEVLVLEGGFVAAGETYAAGDFLSLEERPTAQAVSDSVAGCACLVTCQDDHGMLSD